jgi:alkylation response protein AidB-like acyl-CoA dehydrogenase
MDFTFSEEQGQLRAAVRGMLAERTPPSYVRAMMDDPVGVTDDVWREVAALGWTELTDLVDLVVVLEEMGRRSWPGPFLSSAVLATNAARRLGLDDLIDGLIDGSTRGSIAVDEAGHGDVVDRIRTRASRKTGRWLLDGAKPVVLDGERADWVLVASRTPEGVGTFLVERPGERGLAQTVPTWDPTRRVARLPLDGVEARPVGPPGDQTDVWRRIVDDGCVALCAELIGTMEAANDLAVDYAKQRVQFDRPIATFQVIKHKAADMLHRQEMARVGTHYAAWASDADEPVRAEAAAMAKAFVPEAAIAVTGECIQIHGGVGFTWDCDAHLFYKRAKQNDLLLGYHGIHRQRVAELVLG